MLNILSFYCHLYLLCRYLIHRSRTLSFIYVSCIHPARCFLQGTCRWRKTWLWVTASLYLIEFTLWRSQPPERITAIRPFICRSTTICLNLSAGWRIYRFAYESTYLPKWLLVSQEGLFIRCFFPSATPYVTCVQCHCREDNVDKEAADGEVREGIVL